MSLISFTNAICPEIMIFLYLQRFSGNIEAATNVQIRLT